MRSVPDVLAKVSTLRICCSDAYQGHPHHRPDQDQASLRLPFDLPRIDLPSINVPTVDLPTTTCRAPSRSPSGSATPPTPGRARRRHRRAPCRRAEDRRRARHRPSSSAEGNPGHGRPALSPRRRPAPPRAGASAAGRRSLAGRRVDDSQGSVSSTATALRLRSRGHDPGRRRPADRRRRHLRVLQGRHVGRRRRRRVQADLVAVVRHVRPRPGVLPPLEQELGRALAHRRAIGQGGRPVVAKVARLGLRARRRRRCWRSSPQPDDRHQLLRRRLGDAVRPGRGLLPPTPRPHRPWHLLGFGPLPRLRHRDGQRRRRAHRAVRRPRRRRR